MATMQAYCGLDCGECEAYVATQKNDRLSLEKVARKWTAQYGKEITADICVCDGCPASRRTSTAYAATCGIRLCASARGVPTCAHCPDYACDTLQGFFSFAPVLKERLEAIRNTI